MSVWGKNIWRKRWKNGRKEEIFTVISFLEIGGGAKISYFDISISTSCFIFSEVQWSTGEDHIGGMGDEIEAAYEEFLRTQS